MYTNKQVNNGKKVNNRGVRMTGNTIYLAILTLNVFGNNAPIKRHKIANWVKK
jgi:hypothetical protein